MSNKKMHIKTTKRPIDPKMKMLWMKLQDVADTFDCIIKTLCGKRYAFSMIIYSDDQKYASLIITNADNAESTKKALQEWLDRV